MHTYKIDTEEQYVEAGRRTSFHYDSRDSHAISQIVTQANLAKEAVEALKECQSILSDIYNGKDTFGKVLDAIDSGRAVIAKASKL